MTKTHTHLLLAAAFVVISSGCYRYVPAQVEATPVGTDVRVLVTRAGTSELSEVMELDGNAPLVNGTVVGMEDDDLVLSVPVSQRQDGFIANSIEQRIRVPAGEIVSFERQELDGTATALTVAAAAGALGLVIAIISESLQGEIPDDPGPPDDLRFSIPILSVPWGR